jgi:Trypsin-like peptidase domain
MTGHHRRIPWVVALTAAWVVLGTVPADAHKHPTPIEKSAPGVVYVEAQAKVDVALVEHLQSDPGGVHIAIIQSTSNPVVEKASGFVVDPTGTVVTSGAITATQDDLDRASIYAVNEAFRNRYGDQAPMSGDLFSRQQIGDGTSRLEQRLEACYPPYRTNDAGGCVVRVEPSYLVYPYVTSQDQYGRLQAELLPNDTPDVALLRVRGASGMPTVALGDSTQGAQALSVLGFTDIPNGPDTMQAINTHLAEVGGTTLKSSDMTPEEAQDAGRLADGLRSGMHGGPVVAEAGQVIGFLEPEANSGPPPATSGRLVDIGAIRAVLTQDQITPRRGPVDVSFEAAMHPFNNQGYAASIPNFQQTLALFPGHAMATKNLAVAQENVAAGKPGPAAPDGGATTDTGTAAGGSASGFPWAWVLAAVGVVLLLAAAATLFLRRRRQASRGGGDSPPPRTGKPGEDRPKEGQHAAPSRTPPEPRDGRPATSSPTATGPGERKGAPSGAAAGAVSVIERGAPGTGGAGSPSRSGPARPGSAPPRSGPGPGSSTAASNGSRQESRAAAPTSGRNVPVKPAEDALAFCTSCGARLGPHHRYCGRCGRPAG